MKSLAPTIEALARSAGVEIMRWYAMKSVPNGLKADQTPVTAADLAAHDIIVKGLARLTPGVPIVSEESGLEATANLAIITNSAEYWLVDPLDGTRDYLARSDEFCTCIALVRHGRPVLGVVHAPATGLSYVGEGEVAYRLDAGSQRKELKVRVADHERLVFLVSRQHPAGEEAKIRAIRPTAKIVRLGSALKYVRIAEGLADATVRFTPTSLWDIAAGQAILEAAGGVIADLTRQSLDYSGATLLNPALCAAGESAVLDGVADQLVHAVD